MIRCFHTSCISCEATKDKNCSKLVKADYAPLHVELFNLQRVIGQIPIKSAFNVENLFKDGCLQSY